MSVYPCSVRALDGGVIVSSRLRDTACLSRKKPCACAAAETHVEVADTLRVAAMVQEFRRHGHLVARLDPLRRPARGPWLAEVPAYDSDQRCAPPAHAAHAGCRGTWSGQHANGSLDLASVLAHSGMFAACRSLSVGLARRQFPVRE